VVATEKEIVAVKEPPQRAMRVGTAETLATMRNVGAWLVGLFGVAAAVFLFASSGGRPESATAANPGATTAPLLSCPNVDASPDNKVAVGDILAIVQAYFNDYPATDYYPLYDLVAPYNPGAPANSTGKERVDDILAVVNRYFEICPPLDTQIATATRAIADQNFSSILCDPAHANAKNCGGDPQFLTENASFLAGRNYYQDGTDAPGQGVSYLNMTLGEDNFSAFNPARPEGLLYNNGRLVAQFYVVDGSVPGWQASPNAGWLGYLWNWLPNANRVPDVNGTTNGRFADCFPDVQGWKAYNCPATLIAHVSNSCGGHFYEAGDVPKMNVDESKVMKDCLLVRDGSGKLIDVLYEETTAVKGGTVASQCVNCVPGSEPAAWYGTSKSVKKEQKWPPDWLRCTPGFGIFPQVCAPQVVTAGLYLDCHWKYLVADNVYNGAVVPDYCVNWIATNFPWRLNTLYDIQTRWITSGFQQDVTDNALFEYAPVGVVGTLQQITFRVYIVLGPWGQSYGGTY
jgi:hypothetical protein